MRPGGIGGDDPERRESPIVPRPKRKEESDRTAADEIAAAYIGNCERINFCRNCNDCSEG